MDENAGQWRTGRGELMPLKFDIGEDLTVPWMSMKTNMTIIHQIKSIFLLRSTTDLI